MAISSSNGYILWNFSLTYDPLHEMHRQTSWAQFWPPRQRSAAAAVQSALQFINCCNYVNIYGATTTYAPVHRPHCQMQFGFSQPTMLRFHWHCNSIQSPLRRASLAASHSHRCCRGSTHACHQPLQLLRLHLLMMMMRLLPLLLPPDPCAVVNDLPRLMATYRFWQLRSCCCRSPRISFRSV